MDPKKNKTLALLMQLMAPMDATAVARPAPNAQKLSDAFQSAYGKVGTAPNARNVLWPPNLSDTTGTLANPASDDIEARHAKLLKVLRDEALKRRVR